MTTPLSGRDLLSLADLTPAEVELVLDTAIVQKAAWLAGERDRPLEGKAAALIFQKPSLRTRVSFEVACGRLGAQSVVMSGGEWAFSRGESVYDTAKVVERYVDAVVIRTFDQALVEQLAEHTRVPVINALTDDFHPCQGLADLLTIKEHKCGLAGITMTYVGDGNNMAHTYLLGGALTGMNVRIATPPEYRPSEEVVEHARGIAAGTGATIALFDSPADAVTGTDVVITDTWASMGQEDERERRVRAFAGYTVDSQMMRLASSDAIFMHCLPAHRGEEVTDEVMDSEASAVFDEAENRLHAQQALLSLVMG